MTSSSGTAACSTAVPRSTPIRALRGALLRRALQHRRQLQIPPLQGVDAGAAEEVEVRSRASPATTEHNARLGARRPPWSTTRCERGPDASAVVEHHRPLPTFLIIGADKSATRWLRVNLNEHPDVFAPPGELGFFNSADRNSPPRAPRRTRRSSRDGRASRSWARRRPAT